MKFDTNKVAVGASLMLAASSVKASENPTNDWICNCDATVGTSTGLISPDYAYTASLLNRYLWGDWSTGYMGVLMRSPDIFDEKPGNVVGTYQHVGVKPPNPLYPQNDPQWPSSGRCYQGDATDDQLQEFDTWQYASVGVAVATAWSMNKNSAEFRVPDAGNVYGSAYYWSDSNSMDKRDSSPDSQGQGCHTDQNYGCSGDGTCITYEEDACKCSIVIGDKATVASYDYGEQIAKSLSLNGNPDMIGLGSDDTLFCKDANLAPSPSLQPIFTFMDYASCWVTEDDLWADGGMGHIVEAMNSVWQWRDAYWNRVLPESWGNYGIGEGYWGWNEVAVTNNIVSDIANVADAVVVTLPAMDIVNYPDVANNNEISLCMLSADVLKDISEQLAKIMTDNQMDLPVVMMEVVQGKMSPEDCNAYWGGSDCDTAFRKAFFSQSFWFPDGGCLVYNTEVEGPSDVYYKLPGDPACDGWDQVPGNC